ncbi:MAG: GerAB/ArcD/ProY family transporter [Solirubrobacterales bacterium]
MESGKITERQMVMIMLTITLITAMFFMPQLTARAVAQDAWIVPHLINLFLIPVVLIAIGLASYFPGKSFPEILELLLGRPLGKTICFLYAMWLVMNSSWIIRETGVFLNVVAYAEAPVMGLMLAILAVVLYATRLGVEAWVRVNDVVLPFILIALLAIILLPLNQINPRQILPIGEHSFGSMMKPALVGSALRAQVFLALYLLPLVSNPRRPALKLIGISIGVSIVISVLNLVMVLVFGAVAVGQFEFPFFSLARVISLARIIDRLEILIVAIWVVGIFVKACLFFYCSATSLARIFDLNDYKILIYPLGILILALADNSFRGINDLGIFFGKVQPGMAMIFEFMIPAALLAAAMVRFRNRKAVAE